MSDERTVVGGLPGQLDLACVVGVETVILLTWVDDGGESVDVSASASALVMSADGDALAGGDLIVDVTDGSSGAMRLTVPALDLDADEYRWALTQSDVVVLDGVLSLRSAGFAGAPSSASATVTVSAGQPTPVTVTAAVAGGTGGGPAPFDGTPEAPGTADAGELAEYARGDHVHPPPTAGQIGAATPDDVAAAVDGLVAGPVSSTTGRAAEFADGTGTLLQQAPLTGPGGRPVLDASGVWADNLHGTNIVRQTELAGAITTHAAAVDPHGDRAYTDSVINGLTSAQINDFAEAARDTIAAALVAGSGVTITVDDSGDTITIAATGSSALVDLLNRNTYY